MAGQFPAPCRVYSGEISLGIHQTGGYVGSRCDLGRFGEQKNILYLQKIEPCSLQKKKKWNTTKNLPCTKARGGKGTKITDDYS
jgi:hypothetical protein